MPCFVLLNSGLPVLNRASTVMSGYKPLTYVDDLTQRLSDPTVTLATINSKYKVGGLTGWERPGSDLA